MRSQRLEIYVCTFLATPADGMHVMEKTMRGEDCVDKVKILTVVVHGGGFERFGVGFEGFQGFKEFYGFRIEWFGFISVVRLYSLNLS